MSKNDLKKQKFTRQSAQVDLLIGKVPPQATEIEKAVLGAIMLERGAFDAVAGILYPESFYNSDHQEIFRAMMDLSSRNIPIDMLTVVEQLRAAEKLDAVGGPFYITKLTNSVVSAANIETHARIIYQKHVSRELIRIGGTMIGDAYEDTIDVFDQLEQVDKRLTEITTGHQKGMYLPIGSVITKSINRIEALRAAGSTITGVPSGFFDIDNLTHGWQPTDLIILAARPSVGKTAFALNLARNAAMHETRPVPVGFFSLEMSSDQLVNRLLSAESQIWIEKLQIGNMSDEDMKKLYKSAVEKLFSGKLFIDDSPALTILELKAKARKMKRKEDVGLIIIDYLQLMNGDTSDSRNREREIAQISRGLKELAKELKIPIIALSQLSRETEKRKGENKMPQLSDLRESGAIEQDADTVMFMYRPEYYDISANEMGESTRGETHIRFGKHRHGTLGTVKLKAELAIQKFKDWNSLDDVKTELGPGSWKPVKLDLDDNLKDPF